MKRDYLDCRHSALCDEQGAILILLVFLATGLFAFIALGIDTGLLSVTRRDHAHMSPAVASAALNAFTESTGTFDQRLDIARLRGQEISQAAIDAAITSHFFEGHGYTAELGTASAPGATGFIEPGIWHFAPTYAAPYFDTVTSTCTSFDPSDSCPWKSGTCEWNGPCFEPLDAADFARVPEPTVTAIRALLTSREEAPLRARFAQVFGGQSSFQMESSAIVAARPMRTIFIFYLSRSSHQETHLPYEMVGVMSGQLFNASEYAFRLQNKTCLAGEPLPPNNGSPDLAYINNQLTCRPIAGLCGTINKIPPLGPSDCVLSGGLAFSAADGAYNALFNSCRGILRMGERFRRICT